MTRSDIQKVLMTVYPAELVDSVLTSYENALAEYKKEHWQYFGNEIGQFVEVARRLWSRFIAPEKYHRGALTIVAYGFRRSSSLMFKLRLFNFQRTKK